MKTKRNSNKWNLRSLNPQSHLNLLLLKDQKQNRTVVNERRQSLTSSLMLDPATAHAESGIIDPSAILRGSDGAGIRSRSEGILGNSTEPGETDKILNKWDN